MLGGGVVVKQREVITLLLILAVAALVRLGRPDLTEFKADEGRLLTAALTMSDGEFALRGISSSVGFPNAPMSVWLYALPLVIWPHPYAATLFTGLLSVVAVWGTYWLGRRYWGLRAATVAALLLAVSPWAIVFSRKIWAQNLLPVFAVAWAIGAVLAFVDRRRAFIVLHLVCLAIAVQIHPAAIGLLPATLLFMIVFRRRIDWRYFLIGGVLAALTALPFLIYLYGRWSAEGSLPFSAGQSIARISFDSLAHTLAIATGDGVRALAGPDTAGLPGEDVARIAWVGLIVAGAGWGIWLVARRRDEPASEVALIFLAWLLSPVLFFAWHRTPVYIHYFIVVVPAACLLAGVFFDRLLDSMQARGRLVAWVLLGISLVMQLAAWANVMVAVAREPMAGGFGIPLGVKVAAADRARALLGDTDAGEVLLAGDGSDPELQDFPAEFRAMLHGVPVRYVDINSEAVFPAIPAVVLLDTSQFDKATSTRDLYATVVEDWDSVSVPGSDLAYVAGALSAKVYPAADVLLDPPPLLANFVRIIGHNILRTTTEGTLWDLFWRPADNPDPAEYHLFNHLIDGAGARLAQADGKAFSGDQWRPGDLVISRFLLPVDDGLDDPRTMRVGMYRYPSLENVPVLDEAANPAADAVEISLSN